MLWDTLWEAGRPHGLLAGGYRAIDSLRLEKGYRVWSSDITPEETPYEAGLGFAVRLSKDGGFIGRDALVAAKEAGPRKRLACLVIDDPRSVALGNEPVRVNGEIVGRVTSGGYGFAVERSIAYAYLPPALAEPGQRGGGRDLRRLGRLHRERRAALRPRREPDQGLARRLLLGLLAPRALRAPRAGRRASGAAAGRAAAPSPSRSAPMR